MKRANRIAGVCVLLAIVSVGARADNAAVKRELDKLNTTLIRATVRRDSKAVMALMTPDFTLKPVNGKVYTKAQAETEMKRTWPSIKAFRFWNLTITDFKVNGDSAIGTVEERMTVDLKDKKGHVRPTTLLTVTKNTWRKTKSGWKFSRMEDIAARAVRSNVSYVPFGSQSHKRAKPPGAASDYSEAEARRLLEIAYAGTRKAFRAKDSNGVLALTTPDYVVEYPDRTMTRRQVRDALVSELRATKSVNEWVMAIGAITLTGDSITAEVKERKVSTLMDSRGKPHSQVVEDTTRDTWRLTNAGWRNTKTTVLSSRVVIDGKVQAS